MVITLARPQSWLEERGAVEGARIWLELDEMELSGWATVRSIRGPPEVAEGVGRVVLATFRSWNTVHRLSFEGSDETLEPTSGHLLYSVDRDGWVPTREVQPGERLRTLDGFATVEANVPQAELREVFNLEVETSHDYHVSRLGVLSHNTNPCAAPGGAVPTYETPFRPLTPNQRRALQERVNDRTASREDLAHLDWDRRFSNRRRRGVDRFWRAERRRLQAGEPGTRSWTPEQREAILASRTPQHGGAPLEGHHRCNALDHPQLANDATNIYPATPGEHLGRWHGGNFQNDTFGSPLNPDFPEEF